mmetsp:Transcript_10078/g.15095  ORF Transcript_10078/g.15095 Transcript_10078/m.15095 type:complete len:825 (+) Transcript_10078:64-2538(+)
MPSSGKKKSPKTKKSPGSKYKTMPKALTLSEPKNDKMKKSATLKRPLSSGNDRAPSPSKAEVKKKNPSGGVRVVARFRPLNKLELKKKSQLGGPVIELPEDKTTVRFSNEAQKEMKVPERSARFTFDYVFPTSASQPQVYEQTGKSMIDELFNGFNCTILAYGQTGTGKTWSMMGIVGTENQGVIPRIVEDIFTGIQNADVNIEFAVEVSYVEIYLENIKDLLHPANDNLKIRENREKGIWIQGVTETYVTSNQEVLDIMETGGRNRAIASTNMNAESSRSHSVFILKLTQKHKLHGSTKCSKLILVDLAGSEKVSKTGASGQTLVEAQAINRSLSALGNVIKSLTTNAKHIPYRDSKLTRLLSDSLGGNSKTCLIITGTMSYYNMEETLSTMRFGKRAKQIKNKPKVNEERSIAEYKALLAEARAKIRDQARLIQALKEEPGGVGREKKLSTAPEGGPEEAGKRQSEEQQTTQPRRTARRLSSINTIVTLQAKCAKLEKEYDDLKEANNNLQDSLADAKNDAQNASLKVESLQTKLTQADKLRKEAVEGVTYVLSKRLTLAQKECKIAEARVEKLSHENHALQTKLSSKKAIAESLMAETKKSITPADTKGKSSSTNTSLAKKAQSSGGATKSSGTTTIESLQEQNERLMQDLAQKCADMIQMRMEIEEYKNQSAEEGGLPPADTTLTDELDFQKSLVKSRDDTIELLEGALHDSNVFARKMYDEYEGKIKQLKNTITKQRFIIETSLKPVKKMVKKIMGGGGASPPMSPIRGRRRGHSEWRAELEETMKANAKSSTTVKPADSQKHMEFLQRLKSRASMHEF